MENYKLYINSQFIDSSSKKTFQSIDPSTEQPWASIAEANAIIENSSTNKKPTCITLFLFNSI